VDRHEDDEMNAEGWRMTWSVLEDVLDDIDQDDPDADYTPKQKAFARAYLADNGDIAQFLLVEGIVLEEDARTLLLDIMLPDFVAATTALARRAEGDFKTPIRAASDPSLRNAFVRDAGLTCWTLFEAWVHARKPAAATVNRWRSVFLDLRARFGDRDIASIKVEEAEEWKDTLVTEARSAGVASGIWLRAARVIFAWALEKRKAIRSNPFSGLQLDVPHRQKLREREFTDAEIKIILQATIAPSPPRMAEHNAAARRWVPWICAYTGSRPGEVTQLRGEDVTCVKGAWQMRITPEAGTQKNRTARIVPLHEHLIAQGFGAFVASHGGGPLFCDPTSPRRKLNRSAVDPGQAPAVKARNKLAAWVRELGVTDANISPQHAWRHTFKRVAARHKIERRFRFAFCGHSSKEEGDSYETPSLDDMAKALKRFPRYAV
jgi:integrase